MRAWKMALAALALSGSWSYVRPASGAPAAWKRVVLVELFTSQGCSSCPPADEFVRDFPRRGLGPDKVLPLTFHVNYWNDLGWRDPFATPAFTERQRWYVGSGRLQSPGGEPPGLSGLYTPQMIVAGAVHFSGQQKEVAVAEITRAASRPADIDLAGDAAVQGDDVTVTLRVTPRVGFDRGQDWRAVVALAAKSTRTRVLHGENRGETLEEAAVVRALSDRLPLGAASVPLRIALRKPPELAWADVELVAFVQSEITRQVAAARTVDLPR